MDILETYKNQLEIKHFHNGSEAGEDVEESVIGDDPVEALRQFLHFVEETLGSS